MIWQAARSKYLKSFKKFSLSPMKKISVFVPINLKHVLFSKLCKILYILANNHPLLSSPLLSVSERLKYFRILKLYKCYPLNNFLWQIQFRVHTKYLSPVKWCLVGRSSNFPTLLCTIRGIKSAPGPQRFYQVQVFLGITLNGICGCHSYLL